MVITICLEGWGFVTRNVSLIHSYSLNGVQFFKSYYYFKMKVYGCQCLLAQLCKLTKMDFSEMIHGARLHLFGIGLSESLF